MSRCTVLGNLEFGGSALEVQARVLGRSPKIQGVEGARPFGYGGLQIATKGIATKGIYIYI